MTVRLMTTEDLDRVAALERDIFSDAWSRDSLSSSLDGKCYLLKVAECGEEIVGYYIIMAAADEAEILRIAVDGGHRREGIGRLLMTDAITEAGKMSCNSIFLEVRSKNVPALTMYESFGFERTGIRKEYYAAPVDDAVLMARVADGDGNGGFNA